MNYLIIYDLSHKRYRKTLPEFLKANGLYRLQKSVFLGKIDQKRKLKIMSYLKNISDSYPKTSIIMIPIDTQSINGIHQFGEQKDINLYIQEKLVIFV